MSAQTISAVNKTAAYLLGSNGNLRLPDAPGSLPRARIHVDCNVIGCSAVDRDRVYVMGSGGNFSLEAGLGVSLKPLHTRVLSEVGYSTIRVHDKVKLDHSKTNGI